MRLEALPCIVNLAISLRVIQSVQWLTCKTTVATVRMNVAFPLSSLSISRIGRQYTPGYT